MSTVSGGVRSLLKGTPVLGPGLLAARQRLSHLTFPGSARYWEERYAGGCGSGAGSQGRLREFKAEAVNAFLEEEDVQSVIEFGCGDGEQLELAEYPAYIGLDVSPTAVRLCMRRFSMDVTKSFFIYDPTCFRDNHGVFRADVSLSLDVVYHLVEDESFDTYMRHLFAAARRFVIVYSTNRDEWEEVGVRRRAPHIRHRRFSEWIGVHLPDWELADHVPNRYPSTGFDHTESSGADFYIYRPCGKRASDDRRRYPASGAPPNTNRT